MVHIQSKQSLPALQAGRMIEEIFNPGFDFEKIALEIFRYQANKNVVYKNYLEKLKINPDKINSIVQIPFVPIQFFKTQEVITQPETPQQAGKVETVFTSSGTSGSEPGKHHVADLKIYEQSFLKCFELFYGNIEQYCFLALLPSYRKGSSLIYMADQLIKKSQYPRSGFYLNNLKELSLTIQQLEKQKQKTILLGVTYALLDFAEKFPLKLRYTVIMETGGMKGKRKELVKEEVHNILCNAFSVDVIHSEYGMTELLSQGYSKGKGIFQGPPWMKIFIRDVNDPMNLVENGKTGGINIIDLANIYSCSFIATQDLGKKHGAENFEVLGRFDDSDLRGCNLMAE